MSIRASVAANWATKLLGVLLFGALVWRFAPHPWVAFGALTGVDAWIVAAAVVVNAAGIAIRAEAWRGLLRHVPGDRVRIGDALTAYVVGLVGNALLPARAGEAARVNVMGRRLGGDGAYALVAGSVVAHRLLDCVPFALLILLAVALAGPSGLSGIALPAAAIGIVAAAGAAVLLLRRAPSRQRGSSRLITVFAAVRRGAAEVGRPGIALRALGLLTVAWAAQLVVVWLALAAFGLPHPVGTAALVLVAANVAAAVPLLPGGVGMFQAAVALSLGAGGTAAAAGIAFGVGLQGLELLTTLLVGLPTAAREGLLVVSRRRAQPAVVATPSPGRPASEPTTPS